MNNLNTNTPHIKWAQRKDKLYITIEIANLVSHEIILTNEGYY